MEDVNHHSQRAVVKARLVIRVLLAGLAGSGGCESSRTLIVSPAAACVGSTWEEIFNRQRWWHEPEDDFEGLQNAAQVCGRQGPQTRSHGRLTSPGRQLYRRHDAG